MHALRVTMTKTRDKIVLDFTGTSREAKGPINWPIDYADGKFVRKWLGPVLRSLARNAGAGGGEIDMNEGVLDIIEVDVPAEGHAGHAEFREGHRACGSSRWLRSLGIFAALLAKATAGADAGRPRDHSHLGSSRRPDRARLLPVPRGSRRRRPRDAHGPTAATSSMSSPTRATFRAEFSETRYPVIVEKLGLATDSGGAGYRRGGLGYDKRVRVLAE